MIRTLLAAVLALASLSLPAGPAAAHPHVWIEVRSTLLYGPAGRLLGVRHRWTFDEAYSSFAVEGLDADRDGRTSPQELRELASTNVASLADSGFFTFLKLNGRKQALDTPRGEHMLYEGGRLTLTFEVPLKNPAPGQLLGLEVYDPSFFVDFQTAASSDAVTLEGAPAGCAVTVSRPKAPPPTETGKPLAESLFQSLTGANPGFGASFASRAVVACP